jgi:hypothetical protein
MLRGIFHHPLHFRHALDGANGAGETRGIGVPGRSIQTIPGHFIDAQDLFVKKRMETLCCSCGLG